MCMSLAGPTCGYNAHYPVSKSQCRGQGAPCPGVSCSHVDFTQSVYIGPESQVPAHNPPIFTGLSGGLFSYIYPNLLTLPTPPGWAVGIIYRRHTKAMAACGIGVKWPSARLVQVMHLAKQWVPLQGAPNGKSYCQNQPSPSGNRLRGNLLYIERGLC